MNEFITEVIVEQPRLHGYIDTKKKSCIQETPTLSTCADNSIVSQTKKNIWVWLEAPPRFKALRECNPEKILLFNAPCGDDPRVKHPLSVDDPQVQSGTTPCF